MAVGTAGSATAVRSEADGNYLVPMLLMVSLYLV